MKITTLVELAKQVIGPMIDACPDISLQEIARRLNGLNYKNSKGRDINPNSISWALQVAFPDGRYRRRDKCSKTSYSQRSSRNLNLPPVEIPKDSVFINPTPNDPLSKQEGTISSRYSSRDSEAPNSISPRELVDTILDGKDAVQHWSETRDALGVAPNAQDILSKFGMKPVLLRPEIYFKKNGGLHIDYKVNKDWMVKIPTRVNAKKGTCSMPVYAYKHDLPKKLGIIFIDTSKKSLVHVPIEYITDDVVEPKDFQGGKNTIYLVHVHKIMSKHDLKWNKIQGV